MGRRIAGRLAKPHESPAHCRGAQPQPASSAGHAALGKQDIGRDKRFMHVISAGAAPSAVCAAAIYSEYGFHL